MKQVEFRKLSDFTCQVGSVKKKVILNLLF